MPKLFSGNGENDVTPGLIVEDAGRIGDMIRELDGLEWKEGLVRERIYKELGEVRVSDDSIMRDILVAEQVREELPELVERVRFLRTEIEAIRARAWFAEKAAVAAIARDGRAKLGRTAKKLKARAGAE